MLLKSITERSAEWHKIRLKNIGGSEIAGLFGVQADYQLSAYTLHMVKSGRIPAPPVDDAPGSRIWFGVRLEPMIAAMAAELHGWEIEKGGYCLDDTIDGMACSLDYIIKEPGKAERKLGFTGPGVMQVKNIDMIQHKQKWTGDEPPFSVLLQLQHEMACAGCTWGTIVGMIGGNELPSYPYAIRDKTVGLIRQRVSEFWERVQANTPPLVDNTDSTADTLAAMYPELTIDFPIDLTTNNEVSEVCAGLIVATADRKAAAANEQGYKNRLRDIMGKHKTAFCNGFAISGVFTPANEGRRADDFPPETIIGKRAASLWFKVKELAA